MPEELRVNPGMLLASWPDMLDPNFMHTVVLICQHTPEGAFGFVLNRLAKPRVKDLVATHALLSKLEFPVFQGGPMESDTMQFIHRVPEHIPGGICLDEGLWLGGDVEALASLLDRDADAASSQVKFFLGYSGWGATQLEAELAGGSWLPAKASPEALFGMGGEDDWRAVVRSVGPAGSGLEQEPPDISWN